MPELPEVETVRRGLQQHLVGRRIERVEVGRERSVRRTSREVVIAGLTDTVVEAADRRGKYLLLPLDSGDTAMIHLRMSGQVLLAPAGADRPAHAHVVLHLDDGHEAWFVDPRTFGEVVVFDPNHVAVELPELARLGVDPIADPFDAKVLHSAFGIDVAGAQTAAARPACRGRHRQHLRRRDPPQGTASPRSAGVQPRPSPPNRPRESDRRRARRSDRGRWLDARRRPVRRPDGGEGLVSRRTPRVRTWWRTVPHVRSWLGSTLGHRRPRHALVPGLPALTLSSCGQSRARRVRGRFDRRGRHETSTASTRTWPTMLATRPELAVASPWRVALAAPAAAPSAMVSTRSSPRINPTANAPVVASPEPR